MPRSRYIAPQLSLQPLKEEKEDRELQGVLWDGGGAGQDARDDVADLQLRVFLAAFAA
jgi:hypothetical protein